DRYACSQRLHDRVPPGHPLVAVHAAALGPTCSVTFRPDLGLVRLVVRPVRRLRRRPLALEPSPDPTAGPGRRSLRGLADRAFALAVAWHQEPSVRVHFGPSGVSSTAIPAAAIRSRIASARAQSLSARAAARSSRRPATRPSTAARKAPSSDVPIGP